MPAITPSNPISCIPCFCGLKPGDSQRLGITLGEKSYTRGEIIFVEGEPCPGLFIVKSGSVKLYRTSAEGEEQIVRIIRHGGCFECAPLFDKGPNPVSAETLEASTLYFLPAAVFQSIIKAHPEVVLGIVPVLAMRLRSLIGMVEDFSFRTAYSRVANLLLQLMERRGDEWVISPDQPLNQQHLACMLGYSRQVVNSSLRKMVVAGLIRMDARRIVVVKLNALREVAGSSVKAGTGNI